MTNMRVAGRGPGGRRPAARAPTLLLVVAATLALGALFGLIEAAQTHVRGAFLGRPVPWAEALRMAVPSWLLFGLVAPAAFLIAERFRLDRRPRWSAALVHVVGATLFAIVHQLGVALFVSAMNPGPGASVLLLLRKLLTLNFAIDVIIYCALVGGCHAFLYYREFRERELAASQLQAGLTQARLEALRAQLNPHFLFNTLNAIAALALKGDQKGVVQMLSLLSDLLRLSLDANLAQTIALADELAFTDRYLELQRIRFSDRLEIQQAIEPETLRALVPSLLLQPVVENAVLHGVAAQRGPGRLEIHASRQGERLQLEVRDTGPGFQGLGWADADADGGGGVGASVGAGAGAGPDAGAGAGVDAPRDASGPAAYGVGLRNTRARLQHLYGDAQSLTCRNGATGGATVIIQLPFTRAPAAPGVRGAT